MVPQDTRVGLATAGATREGVTRGGHRACGFGRHAAEAPTPVDGVPTDAEGGAKGTPCACPAPPSAVGGTRSRRPSLRRCTGARGLGALVQCSTAARQRVPKCTALSLAELGVWKGAQGTASLFACTYLAPTGELQGATATSRERSIIRCMTSERADAYAALCCMLR